ncbi:MAG: hypothetical protein OXF02_04090 [Simkaniaceae bacterium]|nr:hypothetical protein [Simkaniaceae bacterium]
MKTGILFAFSALCILLAGCTRPREGDPPLVSVHTVDRNGFRETVTSRDRLNMYERTCFTDPQPYVKVARMYARKVDGKIPSKLTTYHDNGAIRKYLEVINGRASGIYREWYPNGRLRMEVTVIEGVGDLSEEAQEGWVFDGAGHVFREGGGKEATFHYEKGLLQGVAEYYFPDGRLKELLPYEKGRLHGEVRLHNPEGIVIGTSRFVRGVPSGPSLFKGDGERPPFTEIYEGGRLTEAEYGDFSGRILSRIEGGSGEKAVFAEGYLHSLEEYRNGLPEGAVRIYDRKRRLRNLFHVKEGRKHGEEWIYRPGTPGEEPVPHLLITYVEGRMRGISRTWFADGTLESEKEMCDNRKHGLSFARYKDGTLRLMEEYRSGKLVSGRYEKRGEREAVSSVKEGNGIATLYDEEGYFIRRIRYEKGQPCPDEP